MTKVGEGKELPKEPTVESYHREIEHNASKFLNALESYEHANSDEKTHLKSIMDESLKLIHSAVKEIKQKGIYKKDMQVEKDYKEYMASPSPEKLTKLEEDLSEFRGYNKLSE